MTTIRNATDEELAAETRRREELRKETEKPQVRDNIDWGPVIDVLVQYREFVASENHHDGTHFKQYIYETAVTAVFGDGFWSWLRKRA